LVTAILSTRSAIIGPALHSLSRQPSHDVRTPRYLGGTRHRPQPAAGSRGPSMVFMSPMCCRRWRSAVAPARLNSGFGIRLSTATRVLGHSIICVPLVIRMVGASGCIPQSGAARPAPSSLGASRCYIVPPAHPPADPALASWRSLLRRLPHLPSQFPVSLFPPTARNESCAIKLWAISSGVSDVRVAAVYPVTHRHRNPARPHSRRTSAASPAQIRVADCRPSRDSDSRPGRSDG